MTEGHSEAYERGYADGRKWGKKHAEQDYEENQSPTWPAKTAEQEDGQRGWHDGYVEGFRAVKGREPRGVPMPPGGVHGGLGPLESA